MVSKVSDTISHHFAENVYDELSEGIWEGHKVVLRRELILLGCKLKKEGQIDFQKVLTALQHEELRHKHQGDAGALGHLTELRVLFSCLLDRHARRQLCYLSCKFYELGNKCGKMLARAL